MMSVPNHRSLPSTPLEGRRQTAQRGRILDILDNASGPLTAAQIYDLARHDVPDLGLSTVYRTLKILQDTEAVRLVMLPDAIARYEKAGRGLHHFQCRTCGQIWTLRQGAITSLRGARLVGGFCVEEHESTFHGQCSSCQATSR